MTEAARLTHRLHQAPAETSEFDLHTPLHELLNGVRLSVSDGGGSVQFIGADPILPDRLRLAGATSIALAAKSIAVAHIWQLRGGSGQEIAMDLRAAPHRLCPFYDRKWELLSGYPVTDPVQLTNSLGIPAFYRTADDRWVHPMNPYPRLRHEALGLLGVVEDHDAIAAAIRQWNAEDLETAARQAGVVTAMCRSTEEFIATEQYQNVLSQMPPIIIEKIADSAAEPFTPARSQPLEGLRALGRAHVIAGAGAGRAMALHGADVLNIWGPNEYEIPTMYATSSVGMRSSRIDLTTSSGQRRMRALLSDADVFFSNRRPGYLRAHDLDPDSVSSIRPGIIHASVTLNGDDGPWADMVGFDQTAGALTGIMLPHGLNSQPTLPAVPVVNDYITAWFLELGILAALSRRAREGGSYRVSVSLSRVALWILSLGTLDLEYARATAGSAPRHEYRDPQTFTARTPMGLYQGVTEQIVMSQTPGHYASTLVAPGSDQPQWLARPLHMDPA